MSISKIILRSSLIGSFVERKHIESNWRLKLLWLALSSFNGLRGKFPKVAFKPILPKSNIGGRNIFMSKLSLPPPPPETFEIKTREKNQSNWFNETKTRVWWRVWRWILDSRAAKSFAIKLKSFIAKLMKLFVGNSQSQFKWRKLPAESCSDFREKSSKCGVSCYTQSNGIALNIVNFYAMMLNCC